MTLEEAIFRSEVAFKSANLQECRQFWEEEILKEHPQKTTLLNWIEGVKIEEFLSSFTDTEFQGINLRSHIIIINRVFHIMSHLNLKGLWMIQFGNGFL